LHWSAIKQAGAGTGQDPQDDGLEAHLQRVLVRLDLLAEQGNAGGGRLDAQLASGFVEDLDRFVELDEHGVELGQGIVSVVETLEQVLPVSANITCLSQDLFVFHVLEGLLHGL